MPVLWIEGPVYFTAFSLCLCPFSLTHSLSFTLCVCAGGYAWSLLWFLVLSSCCFLLDPHPSPPPFVPLATQKKSAISLSKPEKEHGQKKDKGGPGQWGSVLEYPRLLKRKMAKNVWEISWNHWFRENEKYY